MEETANIFQGSPQQDEQWRREPTGPTGRVQAIVRLAGPLDRDAVSGVLRDAVTRHESLRTTFVRRPGFRYPLQAVGDELAPRMETLSLAADAPEAELERALAAERERPLDHERGPLVHALLVSRDPERHTLALTLSTLCADAASASLLAADLAGGLGADVQLVEDPLQYPDFAAWQLELSDSDQPEARAARAQWSELADARAPRIPFAGGAGRASSPQEIAVELPPGVTGSAVHAAWHALLSRLGGGVPFAVPYLSAARRHEDLTGAVGAFARPVPLSPDVAGGASFASLHQELRRLRDEALELQDYAPAEAPPALTVGFCEWNGFHASAAGLTIHLERIVLTGTPWRLWLSCTHGGEPAAAWLLFDPGCYEPATVRRLGRELEQLIAGAVADPGMPVAELPVLDGEQREQILRQFNDTAASVAPLCLHELFAAHAASSPERPAVIDESGVISYGDLDACANQLAHRLRAVGVGPDVGVGLCTDRSLEMVIGLLGILKAGGFYIPLHSEHPPARLERQLSDAAAQVIVTQEALLAQLPESGEVICLDRPADRSDLEAEPQTPPSGGPGPENLAYVIYTSGSTGVPKGVAVTHGNLTNYVTDITRRLGAGSERLAFGLVTAISTDLGNTSVFGALGSGGTLVLLSPGAAADPSAFARQLERTPVDVLKITPSHLAALLAGGDSSVLPRRILVMGGERAPWDLVRRVRGLSSCAILNHYGPTEATIGCCTLLVGDGPGHYEPATVPIGRPIANTTCYVLDEHDQPTPLGVPGTLFVGGAGVARGYIGQDELTSERFLADPFAGTPGARMYDTGDIVRWLPDGTLEFLGRVDEQVKIRGYRVEPAEVEIALRAHPQVADAVVVAAESSAGDRRLVAYCTGSAPGDDELQRHLRALLPEFMIPSAILMLEEMPRTPSGKVDRLALPDPLTVADPRARYVAPRTPVEQAIATLWSQTLGLSRVGVEDDFFELGGHSLLATQVVAQIRTQFAVDLPLHSLFLCPTVETLAVEVVQLMGASEEDETAKLLAELETLSDEEAEQLLGGERARLEGGAA
jgi:amino acid adenylation domain-containing protein